MLQAMVLAMKMEMMIIENRNKPPYHSAASTPGGSWRNVGKQQSLVFRQAPSLQPGQRGTRGEEDMTTFRAEDAKDRARDGVVTGSG